MKSYFRGWYFKIQGESATVAFIPSYHIGKDGTKEALLQVVTESRTYSVSYRASDFNAVSDDGIFITLGKNIFCNEGISLDIEMSDFTASGTLHFGASTRCDGDIMGPFAFVPFLECRHTVESIFHTVSGKITINGEKYDFRNAIGYIEGDSGSSFPSEYIWFHSFFARGKTPASVMLSVAEIPFGLMRFTGIIGFVYLDGKQYRIATYHGAKCAVCGNTVTVRQGEYILSARLALKNAEKLSAPVKGKMGRRITENIKTDAEIHFEKSGETIFDCRTSRASAEFEYKHDIV